MAVQSGIGYRIFATVFLSIINLILLISDLRHSFKQQFTESKLEAKVLRYTIVPLLVFQVWLCLLRGFSGMVLVDYIMSAIMIELILSLKIKCIEHLEELAQHFVEENTLDRKGERIMSAENIANIVTVLVALFGGGVVGVVIKAFTEKKKINAEANNTNIKSLLEIDQRMNERMSNLEERVANLEQENYKLKLDKLNLEKATHELEVQNSDLKAKNKKLTEENRALKSELTALKKSTTNKKGGK